MDSQAAPLIGKPTKTPAHTLTRVRNNQRRHRQRRREYIESLEQKLEATEETVRQLEIENEALRKQLSSQNQLEREMDPTTTTHPASTDVDECRQAWYKPPHARETASSSATRSTTVALKPGLTSPQVQTELNNGTEIREEAPLLSPSLSATLFPDDMLPSTYAIQPSAMQSSFACCSETSSEPRLFGKGTEWPANRILRPLTKSNISTTFTTLCSEAYLIIQDQNRRGLSLEVIESWLWPGFIYSEETAESGCRVDSRLLLGLLVYVAEDSDVERRILE
jgi:hypothetical protein